MNILFMLYKLVAHSLIEISASVAQLRQILDRFLHQVETVCLVLDTHIKRCGDRAFFFITADMNITVIVTAIDELVYESRIAVESKDHRLIFGEEDVISELAALIDGAGCFRRAMAGHAAREADKVDVDSGLPDRYNER